MFFNNIVLTQQKVQVGKRGRGSITNPIFVKQPAPEILSVVVDIIQHLVAIVDKIVEESLISFDQARETLPLKIPPLT